MGVASAEVHGRIDALHRNLAEIKATDADFVELFGTDIDIVVGARVVGPRVDRVRASLEQLELRSTLHLPIECNLMDETHAPMHHGIICA